MGRLSLLVALILVQIMAGRFVLAADAPKPAPPTELVTGPAWHPEKFPIGFWCGPPKDFVTQDRIKQVADAGFTIDFPPCGATDVETNHKLLDYCQADGLKAFIGDPRTPMDARSAAAQEKIDAIVADYSSYPALGGYFIADEPGAAAFPGLASVVKQFREKDPKHPAFINMFPNYVDPSVLAAPSYDTFFENYAHIVHPAILSYDHYHFLTHSDRPGFFANLETVRRVAMQTNTPFWNIVLLINHFDYRNLTEPELRWEAMQSLAYGAKGILFFTYWQPDKSGMWGEAVINFDGTPTRKYEYITHVNHDIQAIGKYLLNATSLRSYQFGQGGDETNVADFPIRFQGPNITVGWFKDGKTNYVMFANRDYKNDVTKDVFLSTGGQPLQKLDKSTDQWNDVQTQPTGETKITLQIGPGDADLYRW